MFMSWSEYDYNREHETHSRCLHAARIQKIEKIDFDDEREHSFEAV